MFLPPCIYEYCSFSSGPAVHLYGYIYILCNIRTACDDRADPAETPGRPWGCLSRTPCLCDYYRIISSHRRLEGREVEEGRDYILTSITDSSRLQRRRAGTIIVCAETPPSSSRLLVGVTGRRMGELFSAGREMGRGVNNKRISSSFLVRPPAENRRNERRRNTAVAVAETCTKPF